MSAFFPSSKIVASRTSGSEKCLQLHVIHVRALDLELTDPPALCAHSANAITR
jgi:hypothetical protein